MKVFGISVNRKINIFIWDLLLVMAPKQQVMIPKQHVMIPKQQLMIPKQKVMILYDCMMILNDFGIRLG